MLDICKFKDFFQQIFQLSDIIKKQVLIDEWMRESTDLIFIMINETECSDKMTFSTKNKQNNY